MEVNSSDQIKENEDPWRFLEKELQEFEKAMKALEEGKYTGSGVLLKFNRLLKLQLKRHESGRHLTYSRGPCLH